MAGIPAGRLSIELVAEIARLQADLDKAKRAVNAASADIGKSARAANDNLASIGKGAGAGVAEYSRDVAKLKGAIDPAWASLQRYKDQVALLQRALSQGAITHAQYVGEMRKAVAAHKGVEQAATKQNAGIQQLNYQLNDMATMYSMGAAPMMIFASQAGQVTQAIQLMGGGTSKVAAFLGGPWGMAITTAVVVLAPFIAWQRKRRQRLIS